MTPESPIEFESLGAADAGRGRATRFFHSTENVLITLALVAMMGLSTYDSALRLAPAALEKCHAFDLAGRIRGLLNGLRLAGVAPWVQHLTLVVGMIGGAIAARENRLLALSTLTSVLKGRIKTAAVIFSHSFGAAIAVFLCVASVQFVISEAPVLTSVIRDLLSGHWSELVRHWTAAWTETEVVAYGVPRWVLELFLPFGFGLVAVRLWLHAAATWRGKLLVLVLVAGLVGLGLWSPIPPAQMRWPALGLLLAATVLGAPVFTTLGGAALILFWSADTPIAAIPLTHYSLVVNPSLPTVPLFTLAGYFLAEGGASRRLVGVFQALFGNIRGGPAIVTALVCAFFTSFTGASGVTILALGGLLMPVLLAARYSERNALGLLTGAGSLGLLFPPCLPLILYAIISTQAKAPVTIEQMFLGGILPGVLLVGLTAIWGIWVGPARTAGEGRFDARAAGRAIAEAKWELLLPVVALVALFGGFATPVEASAITALYAFFIETVVYRDLQIRRDLTRVVTECGLLVGGVLLILGVANGFTNYLVDAEIPAKMVEWTTRSVHAPWMFLLLLNLFLLVVGCLMDIYSAIVVVVPLIVPIGREFGIDPVHLGIIFLANLELGYLTPPVGMNLFISSYRFRKPMPEVTRATLPMLFVLLIGVLLITYLPPLTTFLPRWIGH